MLSAMGSLPHWSSVGLTVFLVGLTVGLHYEVLQFLSNQVGKWSHIRPRIRVLVLIIILLLLHIVEIWLFGAGLYTTKYFSSLGGITGIDNYDLLDAVYLSATTYTTVGYGDLIPHGPIRFLIGTEALVGLMMITWSASFTYLEMQNYWKN